MNAAKAASPGADTSRVVTLKADGSYGIRRVTSGCAYGSFETYGEALDALNQAALADSYRTE